MRGCRVLARTAGLSREEWLEFRRRGIGASDAAAVMGLSPWAGPHDVWADKLGLGSDREETEAMAMGLVMEPVIARLFQERSGLVARSRRAILQSRVHPCMLANLDRVTRDADGEAVVELKNVGPWSSRAWDEDGVPAHYVVQVTHQLVVTGLTHGYIAALFGGNRFGYWRVDLDPDLAAEIVGAEERFWRLVQAQEPPPLDGSDAARRIVDARWRLAVPETLELPPDAAAALEELDGLRRQERALHDRRQEIETRIKASLGAYERGACGPWRVAWSPVSTERVDVKRLRHDLPEVAAAYAAVQNYRRLTVRRIDEEEAV